MSTEETHAAFGRNINQLDIVVIDDSKSVQSIIRSMLHALKVARVRTYDAAQAAMDAMIVDPPNLILVDWMMQPVDGVSMLKAMRSRRTGPLATVPAIIVTGSPTPRLVEASLQVGAHAVIAKPLSPNTLQKRIEAVCHDARLFYFDETLERWVLRGAQAKLAAQRKRANQYRDMRDSYLEFAARKTAEAERLMALTARVDEPPKPAPAPPESKDDFGKVSGGSRLGKTPRKSNGIGARRFDPPDTTAAST